MRIYPLLIKRNEVCSINVNTVTRNYHNSLRISLFLEDILLFILVILIEYFLVDSNNVAIVSFKSSSFLIYLFAGSKVYTISSHSFVILLKTNGCIEKHKV